MTGKVLVVLILASGILQLTSGTCEPEVTGMNILSGSSAGETNIIIIGKCLRQDDKSPKNEVWLVSWKEAVKGTVNDEQSNSDKIIFRTPKIADGHYNLRVKINGGPKDVQWGKMCAADREKCLFKVTTKDDTPTVESVEPSSGPPGTIVKIQGNLITDCTQSDNMGCSDKAVKIRRVYVGGYTCDLRINGTDEQYGIEYNEATKHGSFKCKISGTFVGCQDISFIVDGAYGRSKAMTTSMRAMTRTDICMIETRAGVKGVSPAAGSTEGGTILEIVGLYFDETTSPAKVTVGGTPCKVLALEDTKITCVTAPMARQNVMYPGNRGIKVEIWNEEEDLDNIGNLTAASNSSMYTTKILNSSEFSSDTSPCVTKLSGYFVAKVSGVHKFFLKAKASGRLYFSPIGRPEHKQLIVNATSFSQFPGSAEFDLKEGEPYYLEAHQSNPTGNCAVRIAVQVYNTTFNSIQHTSDARNEVQAVEIRSTKIEETQEILLEKLPNVQQVKRNEQQSVALTGNGEYQLKVDGMSTGLVDSSQAISDVLRAIENLPVIGTGNAKVEGTSTNYKVTFTEDKGTRRKIEVIPRSSNLTGTVTVDTQGTASMEYTYLQHDGVTSGMKIKANSDAAEIESAVLDIFSNKCPNDFYAPEATEVQYSQSFESGDSCVDSGTIEIGVAFCGRNSLKLAARTPTKINFHCDKSTNKDDVMLEKFKFLCFASHGHIRNDIYVYYSYFQINRKYGTVSISLAEKSIHNVAVDGWQYRCINIFDLILPTLPSGNPIMGLQILAMHMSRHRPYQLSDVFADDIQMRKELPFSAADREVLHTRRLAVKNNHRVRSVRVQRLNSTSFTVKLEAYNCSSDFSLIQPYNSEGSTTGDPGTFRQSTWPSGAEVTVRRFSRASLPVTGTFDLTYNGTTITAVSAQAGAGELRQMLQTAGLGAFGVGRHGTCAGYKWNIYFNDGGGSRTLITISDSNLKGTDPTITTDKISTGSLFLNPIPDRLLATSHTKPQVVVTINDIPSNCEQGKCDFTWDPSNTPVVSSVVPNKGIKDTIVTITGTGFQTDNAENTVQFGTSTCSVESSSETEIRCKLGKGIFGTYPANVTVAGKGKAKGSAVFKYDSQVTGVNPTNGGTGGGTKVDVTGQGLDSRHVVTIKLNPCKVLFSRPDGTKIQCEVPPVAAAENVPLAITDPDGKSIYSSTFGHTRAVSVITDINSTRACVDGTTPVGITGRGFGSNPKVSIGGKPAFIITTSDTSIDIILPSLPRGSYPVKLESGSDGFADLMTNNIQPILYEFEITSCTPSDLSAFGGSLITCIGKGFPSDNNVWKVKIGHLEVKITDLTPTQFKGELPSTKKTHLVTNQGYNTDYGVKHLAWTPRALTIKEKDCVEWKWNSAPRIDWPKWRVCQTDSAVSTTCKGSGFKSQASSTEGSYTTCFDTAGTYFYWSDLLNMQQDKSNHGQVTVLPLKSTWSGDLSVTASGHKPMITSKRRKRATASCSTISTSGTFTFSTSCAPEVNDITFRPDTDHYTVQLTGNKLRNPGLTVALFMKDIPVSGSPTGQAVEVDYHPTTNLQLCVPYKMKHTVTARTQIGSAIVLIPETNTFEFKPYIHSCSPTGGSCGGADLECKGLHLLDATSSSNVASITVGGLKCQVNDVKNNKIRCRTPNLVAGDHNIVVAYKTICSTPNTALHFQCTTSCTPSITDVIHSYTSGTDTIVVRGDRLWAAGESVDVLVGSTKCTLTTSTATQIGCTLQNRIPGQHDVVVYRHSCGYSVPKQITLQPGLLRLTPDKGSINGGLQVKATGAGFGGKPVVKLESTSEVLLAKSVKVIDATNLEFVTPVGTASVYKVHVFSNSQKTTEDVDFTYDSTDAWTPKLTVVTPTTIVPGDPLQAIVTIIGQGLHQTCAKNTVQLCHGGDLTKCCACIVTSTTGCSSQLVCKAHTCPAGEFEVVVLVEGKGYATKVTGGKIYVDLGVTSFQPIEGSLAGGQVITLQGKGFSETSTKVTVCDVECAVVNDVGATYPATVTKISCKVPKTKGTAAKLCDVKVQAGYVGSITASPRYTYSLLKTPILTSVSPQIGGTAGGTVLTINGDQFGTDATDLSIDIGGSTCTIQSVTDTEVKCTTTPHSQSTLETVVITSKKHGLALGSVKFNYAFYWSANATWPNGQLPTKGEFIVVDRGATMILDTDTAILKMLLINGGTLIVSDTKDINLNSENILITDGGLFQIGSETKPYQHRAVITMYGSARSPELPIYGSKSIGLRKGTLDIHGKSLGTTWTRLEATALTGATTITVAHDVSDWPVNATIVIATTSDRHSQIETEKRKIVTVSGALITLDRPLQFQHFGESKTVDGTIVDIKAEVGLLSRNVVIRGFDDPQWNVKIEKCPKGFHSGEFATQTCFQGRFGEEMGSDQFGAHILIHAPDPNQGFVTARISYTELTFVGQAFRLGRYPVHFHLNGRQDGSYVRGCSFHQTFNRAVNIHGTHNVVVEKNVLHNVMGGAFFLEDGVETGNTFNENLGLFVRSSTSLLNEDITPAFIWVTNPNNTVTGNVAAGGTHFGYWYRLNEHAEGPSFDPNVCPRNVPLGVFKNNSAHSLGWFGFWIFPTYHPMQGGACDAQLPEIATFEDFHTYGCDKGAESVNTGAIHFKNFVMVSNDKSGLEIKLIKHGQSARIIDSHMIDNVPGYSIPGSAAAGLSLPFSPGLECNGVTFSNFNQNGRYGIRVTRVDGKCIDQCGGWSYSFSNSVWRNSPNKAKFEWLHEGRLVDVDGTLSGTKGMTIVPKTDLLNPSKCQDKSEFSGGVAASGCDASVRFFRIALNNALPTSLSAKTMMFQNEHGTATAPFRVKRLTHKKGWMAILPVDNNTKPIMMCFENSNHLTNISYKANVYNIEVTDSVIIAHNLTQAPDRFSIIPGQDANSSNSMVTYDNNFNGDYYFDRSTNKLNYLISSRDRITSIGAPPGPVTRDIDFKVETCFFKGCIQPDPYSIAPSQRTSWFDLDTWKNATKGLGGNNCRTSQAPCLPEDGDDVVITKDQYVFVSGSIGRQLPRLGKLFVHGWLEFSNDQESDLIHLRATHVILLGGKIFTSGSKADLPLNGRLKIELLGTQSTPWVQLQGAPSIGSKVLAVFGVLDLFGKPRVPNRSLARLAKTAKKGDNTIEIDDKRDWGAGDEIVLTSTSFKTSETETFAITNVSGNSLTLNASLAYDHIAINATSAKLKSSNKEFRLAAEVGLLSRSIEIIGAEYDNMQAEAFGARVLIGSAYTSTAVTTGAARIRNVRFRNYGQLGFSDSYDPRFGLAFLNTGDSTTKNPSFVKGCSFSHGFSTAIGVFRANGVTLENNVVFRPVGSGIEVEGMNNVIRDNLVTQLIWQGHYYGRIEPTNTKWPAGIVVNKADNLTLEGNVVAGSDRAGYRIRGEICSAAPKYKNNEAHAVLIGTFQLPGDEQKDCTLISGFKIWRAFDYGAYSQTESKVEMSNLLLSDNTVGTLNIVIGPPSVSHVCEEKTVTIKHSLIAESGELHCEDDVDHRTDKNIEFSANSRSWDVKGGYTGVGWPMFLSKYNGAPSNMKQFKGAMSYPAISGHTLVKDTMFHGFKNRQCGTRWRRSYIFSTNPAQEDHLHSISTDNLILDEVEDESIAFFHRADKGRINPSDCVDMECDAKKKCFIKDKDGSLTGGSGEGTILPEAEFEWGGDPVRGVGDYRIPKVALQDENGVKLKVTDVCPNKGIYRDKKCKLLKEWQAYQCKDSLRYAQLVIESMDADTETRRLSPVAIISCNGASDQYVDLLNGPMDHGWCSGYTCQKRISTFWAVAPLGKCIKIFFSSTAPQKLRLRLLDVTATDSMMVSIFYKTRQELEVSKGTESVLVDPANVKVNEKNEKIYQSTGFSEPKITDSAGTNYFDGKTQLLTVIMRGKELIDIEIKEGIVVDFGLPKMTTAEFYGTNIIINLAMFLGIPKNTIKIVGVSGAMSAGRRRRATTSMVVTIVISNTGGSQINLFQLSQKLVDETQTNQLSIILNITIHTTTVSPPPPKVGSPEYAAYISKINNMGRGPPPPVGVPDSLIFERYPDGLSEGLPFKTQPWLRFTDAKGVPLDNVGTATTNWTVSATLRSGSNPKTTLIGESTATFVDGVVKFTDLQIRHHGSGYIIDFTLTNPTLSERKSIASQPLDVHRRKLRLTVTNLVKYYMKGEMFDMKLNVTDTGDAKAGLNLNWKGHTWTASIALHTKAKHLGELQGHKQGTIDLTNNVITFTDLSFTMKGSYALVVQLVSNPTGYEIELVQRVTVSDGTSYESNKECKLRFITDYSTVDGDEEAFCTTVENDMTVKYSKVHFSGCQASKGSIVVAFQVHGSVTDIDDFHKTLYASLGNYTITFSGYTMKSDGTLYVDGRLYTEERSNDVNTNTVIIAVVCSVVAGGIIVGVGAAVHCAKKRKDKLDQETKQSRSETPSRNFINPLNEDAISLNWHGASPSPRDVMTPSPLHPPPYSQEPSQQFDGSVNGHSPVAAISGQIIPTPRHGLNKQAGHMSTTTTRRVSANRPPNQLRASESMTYIE
ncbi:fibrocystin-L-like [Lineus longissimus]|uniref:fibrocystin-L-like n=1 Tax=Lineus longissimus TaxID=88925 RepID=UPI00315C8B09